MPLHKGGPIDNPDNYRGITLLSCVGKLFTSLLNHRLCNYLNANEGLSEAQSGLGLATQRLIMYLPSI